MAESSLNVPMKGITGRLGNFLGYGYGAENGEKLWTARQQIRITDFCDSGLRRFYFAHTWSFLRPVASLALASGENTVQLPDDFGTIEGPVTLAPEDGIGWRLTVGNAPFVHNLIASHPDATGRPAWCAVSPLRRTTPARSPRADLIFHPTPDAAYTATFPYHLIPAALTSAHPWAYGGAMHVETIIASVLAVAEERLNDERTVNREAFVELLAMSVANDSRNKAHDLGYNGDTSDDRDLLYGRGFRHQWPGTVTFDGTAYD